MNKPTARFTYDDGSTADHVIGKYTVLNMPTTRFLLHIDRLPDGSHLLIGTKEMFPEGKKLRRMDIIPMEDECQTKQ